MNIYIIGNSNTSDKVVLDKVEYEESEPIILGSEDIDYSNSETTVLEIKESIRKADKVFVFVNNLIQTYIELGIALGMDKDSYVVGIDKQNLDVFFPFKKFDFKIISRKDFFNFIGIPDPSSLSLSDFL